MHNWCKQEAVDGAGLGSRTHTLQRISSPAGTTYDTPRLQLLTSYASRAQLMDSRPASRTPAMRQTLIGTTASGSREGASTTLLAGISRAARFIFALADAP